MKRGEQQHDEENPALAEGRRESTAKLEALRRALIQGEASGDAGDLDFDEIRRLGRERARQKHTLG